MKKIYLLFLLIILCFIITSCSSEDEYVRLRIIANSNSEVDILEKTTVKNTIEKLFKEEKLNFNTLTTDNLYKVLESSLDSKIYNKLSINECVSYYPAKSYKGKFIPSGNYQTILIEIDAAKGNNFWTLLYPEYFGFEFEESNEVEFRSYFYDKVS